VFYENFNTFDQLIEIKMKKTLIIFYFILCSLNCHAQVATDDEYEIYGTLIGEQGYQFYPINFGIPSKFSFNIKDSIYDEIEKKQSKEIDLRKLIRVSLKYSISNIFYVLESDLERQIYFSPIYFKSSEEAYFLCIATDNLPKPLFSFYQANKKEGKWEIIDYYIIN
jgi:hypothetical protein